MSSTSTVGSSSFNSLHERLIAAADVSASCIYFSVSIAWKKGLELLAELAAAGPTCCFKLAASSSASLYTWQLGVKPMAALLLQGLLAGSNDYELLEKGGIRDINRHHYRSALRLDGCV